MCAALHAAGVLHQSAVHAMHMQVHISTCVLHCMLQVRAVQHAAGVMQHAAGVLHITCTGRYTLSFRIGKVVASHAAGCKVDSRHAEARPIYTVHEALREYC